MNSVLTLRELFVVSALSLFFLRAVLALFLLCLCAKYEPDVLSLFLALVKLWSSLGRALSSFVELYRAFPNFVKLYRALSSFVGLCQALSSVVKLCQALSSFVELCGALSSFSRALSSVVELCQALVELCGALLSPALSLQLICSVLLCASCALHCFRAVSFALLFVCS